MPQETIHPVGGDDEIVPCQLTGLMHLALVALRYSQLGAADLQQRQELFASQTSEDVASAAYKLALVVDVDSVPEHEVCGDSVIAFVVRFLKRCQRAIGEDDAPSIGSVGRVSLDDGDIMAGVGLFEEETAVQARRPTAQNPNFHKRAPLD